MWDPNEKKNKIEDHSKHPLSFKGINKGNVSVNAEGSEYIPLEGGEGQKKTPVSEELKFELRYD